MSSLWWKCFEHNPDADCPVDEVPADERGGDEVANIEFELPIPYEAKYKGKLTVVTVWSEGRIRRLHRRTKINAEDDFTDAAVEREAERGDIEEEERDQIVVQFFKCSKFGKRITSKLHYHKHIEKCECKFEDNSSINRAINLSLDMIMTGEVQPYERSKKHPRLQDIVVGQDAVGKLKFEEGWALRQKAGRTLGSNTVNLYIVDIKRWYQNGNRDKGKK